MSLKMMVWQCPEGTSSLYLLDMDLSHISVKLVSVTETLSIFKKCKKLSSFSSFNWALAKLS